MRAGPLSNPEVIKLLNAHFVPVYAVNDDYRGDGPQSEDERAEYTRIYREALDAGMSAGTVHVYIIAPDGKTVDSMHVAEAAKTEQLLATLKRNIKRFETAAGAPLVAPKAQSTRPVDIAGDALALHLVSRALGGGGSWGGVVEDWIVLDPDEWAHFVPPKELPANGSWRIDPAVSAKLLTHFYPSTENNDVSKNAFEHQHLDAQRIEGGAEVMVKLSGALKMKHAFYHKPDDNFAEATVVGFARIDPKSSRIRTFEMTTGEATYGGGKFAVGVRLAE